jgi:MoxR-like ATPase
MPAVGGGKEAVVSGCEGLMAIESNVDAGRVDEGDLQAAEQAAAVYGKLTDELSRVIIGQDEVLKQVLIALFAQGHCLLEGVPGLAKTLMISSISEMLSLDFSRIQFTPDLMPSDIVGTEILEEEEGTGRRRMKFVKGPIFGNIILGDEINRTPPKLRPRSCRRCRNTRLRLPVRRSI